MDDLNAKRDRRERTTAPSEALLAHAMEQWGDAVLRLALNQLRNRADAEDVFQDVFLRLLDRTAPFNDEGHLKGWLLRTTINRCHDLQRRAKRTSYDALEEERLAAASITPEGGDPLDEMLRSDVWEKVGRLSADLSAIVHLYYAEGYRTPEIARIVGCSDTTVRTRLYRARHALQTMIEAEEAQGRPSASSPLMTPQPTPALSPEGGMEPWSL